MSAGRDDRSPRWFSNVESGVPGATGPSVDLEIERKLAQRVGNVAQVVEVYATAAGLRKLGLDVPWTGPSAFTVDGDALYRVGLTMGARWLTRG